MVGGGDRFQRQSLPIISIYAFFSGSVNIRGTFGDPAILLAFAHDIDDMGNIYSIYLLIH